jgi:hypothetical protein
MNRFYMALEARYKADIEEALAVLDLYFSKAVGVGEHPDIMSVLDESLQRLEDAKAKLVCLQSLFANSQPVEGQTPVEQPAE